MKKEEEKLDELTLILNSGDNETIIDNLLEYIHKKDEEIEEKRTIIFAGAEKIKRLESQVEELLNVLNSEKKINYIKPIDIEVHNYISKDKIRERIKHNEEQKNIVESVGKIKINDDGITGEGIEGLNDLIVYKSYEAVINELNYLLEEN